jgi:pyruvate kinase
MTIPGEPHMNHSRIGKTKIIATLGPASSGIDALTRLFASGVDIVRLNFSHGTHEDHEKAIANVRAAAKASGKSIGILQDLQGPKIRIGIVPDSGFDLQAGDSLVITTDDIPGAPGRVSTSFKNLPQDVTKGETILIDDGKIRLNVVGVDGNDVRCEVIVGGRLSSHKGINLPGVAVSAPSFTEKDLEDLAFGLEHGVDFVALSFVRTASDIRQLRLQIVAKRPGPAVPIIAKIEKPQAINDLDSIIAEADGIMVARGDLGVELPPEDVPMLQKLIIRKSNAAGKPVIVATQMLESMINSPTPTRAETSDVANAVVDGCDAVMLSGETSVGKYPVDAVQIMNRIVLRVEEERRGRRMGLRATDEKVETRHDALGRAACILADQMDAAAIVTLTHSGQTAKVLSKYRPDPPIIALTLGETTLRRLSLVWGVRGFVMEHLPADSDAALQQIQERLIHEKIVQRGQYVVLLAGQPLFAYGSTNFIKVERVG